MKQVVNLKALKEAGSLQYGDTITFSYTLKGSRDAVVRQYIVSRDGRPSGTRYYLSNIITDDNSEIFRHLDTDKITLTSGLFGTALRDGNFPYCSLDQLYHITHALYEIIETGSYKKPLYFSERLRVILNKNITNDVICALLLNNPDLLHSNNINHLDLTEEGMLDFLPEGKVLHFNEDGSWHSKNRQKGKPASVIKKIISEETEKLWNLTDKDYENFANFIKASSKKLGQFSIVKGEEIKKWYDYKNYLPNQGSLDNSCMRHDSCQEFFDIYVDNPDVVSMLILTDYQDKLLGRAIIWNLPEFVFMDRIYGNDSTITKFHRYAAENNIVRKYQNTYKDMSTFVSPEGKTFTKLIKVKLKNVNLRRLPYLDTFGYMSMNEIAFCNYRPNRYSFHLQSTNGIPKPPDMDHHMTIFPMYDGKWVMCGHDYSFLKAEEAIMMNGMWIDKSQMEICSHTNQPTLVHNGRKCIVTGKFYSNEYMIPLIEGGYIYKGVEGYVIAADTRQATMEPDNYLKQCYYDKLFYQRDVTKYKKRDGEVVNIYVYNQEILSQEENEK